jgi:hypothetical protein
MASNGAAALSNEDMSKIDKKRRCNQGLLAQHHVYFKN